LAQDFVVAQRGCDRAVGVRNDVATRRTRTNVPDLLERRTWRGSGRRGGRAGEGDRESKGGELKHKRSSGRVPIECTRRAPRDNTSNAATVKKLAFLATLVLLAGCRDVRVQTLRQGTTTAPGGNEIAIVRDAASLERLGIRAPVRYKAEFGVVLLMGPHHRSGFRQIVESIRANPDGVRVVAFEAAPADGGEPTRSYRTFTLWIVPNSVYRRGVRVHVVTPSDDPVAQTTLP